MSTEGTHPCTCNKYPHAPDCGRETPEQAAERLIPTACCPEERRSVVRNVAAALAAKDAMAAELRERIAELEAQMAHARSCLEQLDCDCAPACFCDQPTRHDSIDCWGDDTDCPDQQNTPGHHGSSCPQYLAWLLEPVAAGKEPSRG